MLQVPGATDHTVEDLDIVVVEKQAEVSHAVPESIQALARHERIQERMRLEHFLNPPEEQIVDPVENVEDHIVQRYLQGEDEAETSEEEQVQPLVAWDDAVAGLDNLILFEEQQEAGGEKILRDLYHIKRKLERRKQEERMKAPQHTLDSWLT